MHGSNITREEVLLYSLSAVIICDTRPAASNLRQTQSLADTQFNITTSYGMLLFFIHFYKRHLLVNRLCLFVHSIIHLALSTQIVLQLDWDWTVAKQPINNFLQSSLLLDVGQLLCIKVYLSYSQWNKSLLTVPSVACVIPLSYQLTIGNVGSSY